MRPFLLASLALAAAILVACADEDITTPPTATAVATTTANAPPEATTPEVGEGPVVTYLGEPIGNAGAEALPIEVDSFGQLFMDWNDDGTLLAYVSGGDIWVYDGEESRNLTNTPDILEGMPVWSKGSTSADGFIGFASRPFEQGEQPDALLGPQGSPAWMMADGRDYTNVEEGSLLSPVSWNGSAGLVGSSGFAYVLEGQVRFHAMRGEQQAVALTDPQTDTGDVVATAVLSPVRNKYAVHFADSEGQPIVRSQQVRQGIAVTRETTSDLDVLLEWEGPYIPDVTVEWSADGTKLLVTIPPGSDGSELGLWIADVPRDNALPISPARRVEGIVPYQARWSPDGERIAVIENGDRRILVLDADTLEVIGEPGPAEGVAGIAWRP